VIPKLSVSEQTTVVFNMLASQNETYGARHFVDYSFQLSASSASEQSESYQFGGPVYVEIRYTDGQVAGVDETSLELACRPNAQSAWSPCDTHDIPPEIKPEENTLRTTIFETGQFALFGAKTGLAEVFLPLVTK
jgi:hypothetical protein